MSFASEPEREDGNLPPVNIVIPDDARELDRDVLAYRRELRAQRRRQRITRLFGPFTQHELGGHAAILPLIATCVALSLLAGAMLSVITISPASAPTVTQSAGARTGSAGLTTLPAGSVQLDGRTVPVRSLTIAALALVPADCGCGPALQRLADQAVAARVGVYFVATDGASKQLKGLTAHYGGGAAKAVYDSTDVLGTAYHPAGLTVLLVYKDATAQVRRNLPADFELTPALTQLSLPGNQAVS